MVREVRGMGMEVCTTLGMLSPDQARQLKEAYVSLLPCTLGSSEITLQWPDGIQPQP